MALEELMRQGRFVHLVEVRPPKGAAVDRFVENVRRLRGLVDGVFVPDNPDAVMALAAGTAARLALAEGMEPILGVGCRDRNRLAIQSDLLGAHVDGVRIVAFETGTDPSLGDHPGTRGVYDLDPPRAVEAARKLGNGTDLAGGPISGAPKFLVGSEWDPWKPARVEGADFYLTGPVYDAESFEAVAGGLAAAGAPVVVRVVLLKSGGMARYVQRNVAPGRVAEKTIERLQKAPDKAQAAVEIAAQVVRRARAVAGGACITPLGWEAKVPAVLDAAR